MKVLSFDSSNKALSVAILDNESMLAETTINIKKIIVSASCRPSIF